MTSQNMPNQWFDVKDESKATHEAVNTYIEFRLKQYKSTTLRDDSLWEVFHEDFESWIDSTFSKADSYALYDLRDYLRQNGVFVETGRGKRLSVGLAKVLQEEDPHKWTPTEIKDQIEKSVLNSRWNKPKIEVDYIASPRVEATQKEIKPRYRQSRVNDERVREEQRRQKEPQLECLELLLNYFWKIKQGLPDIYRTDTSLKDALINACRGIPECSFALYDPAQSFEGLSAQLRSSIGTAMDIKQSSLQESYQMMTQPEIYWTDRKYFGQGRGRGQGFGRKEPHVFRENANINALGRGRGRRREVGVYGPDFQQRQKKCYVCNKQGCWSTKHPQEERQLAYSRFRTQYTHSTEPNIAIFQGFLANYEGIHGIEDLVEKQDKDKDIDEAQYILDNMQIEDEFQEDDSETGVYFSDDFGKLNGIQILTHLQDQSVWHSITKSDPFEEVSEIRENEEEKNIEDYEDYEDMNEIPGQLLPQNGQNPMRRGRGRPKGSKNKINTTHNTNTQN
ncbi:hypothetical protein EPUL_004351, partial [Erysiphe pulchra]